MPELPEIEALARSLDAALVGREVAGVAVRSPSLMKTWDPPIDELVADAFAGVRRRGKWLLLGTRAERTLALHLMTGGRLRRTDGKAKPARADALVVRFADGGDLRLAEISAKKRSAAHFVAGDGLELLTHLGPEPLDPSFGVEELAAALARVPRQLKPALTDQRTLAGLGNAWSDEVLHAARLSPLVGTARLEREQLALLHGALHERLADGVAHATGDNYLEALKPDRRPYLRVHNRAGEPCPTCGTALAAIHRAERATTYCPACQAGGRVYADRRLSRLLK